VRHRRFASVAGRPASAATDAYRQIEWAVLGLYRRAGLPVPARARLSGDLRDPAPWLRLSALLRSPALRLAYDVRLAEVPPLRLRGCALDQDHLVALRGQVCLFEQAAGCLQELVDSDQEVRYLCPWVSINPGTGRPEVAYWAEDLSGSNGGKARLCFCARGPSGWGQPEVVDSTWRTIEYCRSAVHSLQLVHASDGTPHVCYFDADNATIRHAHKSGSWSSSAIAGISGLDPPSPDVALAVDANDDLGLAYYKLDGGALDCCYASYDSIAGSWSASGGKCGVVGPLDGTGSCFVAFAGADDPVVVWGGRYAALPEYAQYAHYDGGWQAANVVAYGARGFGYAGGGALLAYGRQAASPESISAVAGPGSWVSDGDVWAADVWDSHVTNLLMWGMGAGESAMAVQLGAAASLRRRDEASAWHEIAVFSAGAYMHPRSLARDSSGDIYVAFDNRYQLWCRRFLHD